MCDLIKLARYFSLKSCTRKFFLETCVRMIFFFLRITFFQLNESTLRDFFILALVVYTNSIGLSMLAVKLFFKITNPSLKS